MQCRIPFEIAAIYVRSPPKNNFCNSLKRSMKVWDDYGDLECLRWGNNSTLFPFWQATIRTVFPQSSFTSTGMPRSSNDSISSPRPLRANLKIGIIKVSPYVREARKICPVSCNKKMKCQHFSASYINIDSTSSFLIAPDHCQLLFSPSNFWPFLFLVPLVKLSW